MLVHKIKTTLIKSPVFSFSHSERKKKFFKIIDGKEIVESTVYPLQYPKHPLTDTEPIISRERPVRHVTPKYEVSDEKMMMQDSFIK